MNIVTATVAAFYLSTAAVAGSFVIDFVKDYADMNANVIKSVRTGDLSLHGNRAQIAKVCANSSVILAMQGYGGVRCDTTNNTVKF